MRLELSGKPDAWKLARPVWGWGRGEIPRPTPLVDFGLNQQPMGTPTEPIVVTQRIVMNYYTAKRMFHALMMTLQRHEAAFGVLETDVQRRVQPTAMGQSRG